MDKYKNEKFLHQYELGDNRVCFQSGKVTNSAGECKLEPLPLALLRYLVKHPNQVISYQELLSSVWENRQVSDDAIRRVIKKIRTALLDDAKSPKYLQTVPLKGYQWIGPYQSITSAKKNSQTNKIYYYAFFFIACLLLAFMLGGYINSSLTSNITKQSVASDISQVAELTKMVGSEVNGDYHAGLNTLLFIYRENNNEPFALFSKELSNGKVQRLTFDENNYVKAKFSPDGSSIVFSKFTADGLKNYLASFINNNIKNVREITAISGKRKLLSWSADGEKLYFSDELTGKTKIHQRAIFLYSVNEQTIKQVSFPHVQGYGDFQALESPSGRYLAFFRNTADSRNQLNIVNLTNNSIYQELSLNFSPNKMIWQSEGDSKIILSSFDGDIYQYHLNEAVIEELPVSRSGWNDVFYHCGERCLYVRQQEMNYQDVREVHNPFISSENIATQYLSGNGAEIFPFYDHSGKYIYFTSYTKNKASLIKQDSEGKQQVLWQFNPRQKMTAVTLNPQSELITGKLDNRIFILDPQQQKFRFITSEQQQVYCPFWDRQGNSIYFSRLEQGDYVLHKYYSQSEKIEKVGLGIKEREEFSDGRMIELDTDDQLWLSHTSHSGVIKKRLEQLDHNSHWQLHDDYLYWSRIEGLDVYLHRMDLLSSKSEKRLLTANSWLSGFFVHPDGDRILITHPLLAESDLVKVEWTVKSENPESGSYTKRIN